MNAPPLHTHTKTTPLVILLPREIKVADVELLENVIRRRVLNRN